MSLSVSLVLFLMFGAPGTALGYESGTITACNVTTAECLEPVPIETAVTGPKGTEDSASNLRILRYFHPSSKDALLYSSGWNPRSQQK